MTNWVQDAQGLVDDLLRPAAASVDTTGKIPAAHFDTLTRRGYYGLAFATETPVQTLSDVGEILVSGCLSTAFVWAQHHGTLLRLATSSNEKLKATYLAELHSGAIKAGVSGGGYAQPDHPLVTATANDDGGYTISGRAPFVSGWGLIDVIGITAFDASTRTLVTFVTDAIDTSGMTGHRLPLAAAHATNTVELVFDGLHVPKESVMHIGGVGSSALGVADRILLRINGSLALGVARASLAVADELQTSEQLWAEHADVKRELDNAASGDGDIYAARARASQFAVTAATYCATATGSRAVLRGDDAERLVREAAFSLVCTTTPDIKARMIESLQRG